MDVPCVRYYYQQLVPGATGSRLRLLVVRLRVLGAPHRHRGLGSSRYHVRQLLPRSISMRGQIDLGDNHRLSFHTWDPDPELNPWAKDLPGSPSDYVGGTVYHLKADGSECAGGITFNTPRGRALAERSPGRATWDVQSWEPLTLSPSLLCSCGDHGFIREGRWVRA